MISGSFHRSIYKKVNDLLTGNQKSGIKPFVDPQKNIDIVFFWKQNDSGIYGRRQDMMVKYLMKSGRVNKILHFDAPIHVESIHANVKNGLAIKHHQGTRIAQNCIERFLKLQDEGNIFRRTFVYGKRSFLGEAIPKHKTAFPEFVEKCLAETGISDNVLAWVCPVSWEFPDVQKRLGFSCIVADVIDDIATFSDNEKHKARINENYRSVISVSDVCIVNCKAMKERAEMYTQEAFVIPNGAEMPKAAREIAVPEEIKEIKTPVIGYVGSLSVRVDYDLIEKIAREKPHYSIVLIGWVHRKVKEIEKLEQYPNVHFMGLIPYERVAGYVRCFDVAIIPHEETEMTQRMNPLKLYFFSAMGVPVVATDVINTDEFVESGVFVAESKDDFVEKIDAALKTAKSGMEKKAGNDLLNKISWESRVQSVFEVLERNFEKKASG